MKRRRLEDTAIEAKTSLTARQGSEIPGAAEGACSRQSSADGPSAVDCSTHVSPQSSLKLNLDLSLSSQIPQHDDSSHLSTWNDCSDMSVRGTCCAEQHASRTCSTQTQTFTDSSMSASRGVVRHPDVSGRNGKQPQTCTDASSYAPPTTPGKCPLFACSELSTSPGCSKLKHLCCWAFLCFESRSHQCTAGRILGGLQLHGAPRLEFMHTSWTEDEIPLLVHDQLCKSLMSFIQGGA